MLRLYVFFRLKQSVFFFLWHGAMPTHDGHWLWPSAHGNHACFFFYGLMVEMSFSSVNSLLMSLIRWNLPEFVVLSTFPCCHPCNFHRYNFYQTFIPDRLPAGRDSQDIQEDKQQNSLISCRKLSSTSCVGLQKYMFFLLCKSLILIFLKSLFTTINEPVFLSQRTVP